MAKKKKVKPSTATFKEALLFGLNVSVTIIAPELISAFKMKKKR